MANHMRDIDKKEVWSTSAMTPLDALIASMNFSEKMYTVVMPQFPMPVMMFGIGRFQSLLDDYKQIWMLGTPAIEKISTKFLRHCKQGINELCDDAIVYNYVMEGNNITLRWLHWLGFTILKPKPYGLFGDKFHYVQRDNRCVAQH